MNEATLRYVRQHADDDVRRLALRGSKDSEVDMVAALQQIAGLQLARKKLPTWAANEDVLFPPHLAMEQCSSEATARYKCSVFRNFDTTGIFVDLTGGFGIDFSFLAPLFGRAVYVERQEELCRLAQHNFKVFGIEAEVVCGDGVEYLHQQNSVFQQGPVSVVFIDPARRDEHGARTYGIGDCTPDVLTLRDELLWKADSVVLKLSPMLDWRKTVSDFGAEWVREVHVVSIGGECKELLLVLSRKGQGLRLVCTNDDDVFEIAGTNMFEAATLSSSALPPAVVRAGDYLYEPNASIMKAGCFVELAEHFAICQIAQNSHLFVSSHFIDSFPGRKFQVESISTMNKHELKAKISSLRQANITVRNFPLSVAELRKRLKLSEGGSHYIFATTLAQGNRVLIVCRHC